VCPTFLYKATQAFPLCAAHTTQVDAVNTLGLKTQFVTYPVRTDSALPGLIAVGQEVKRRFSDFDVSTSAAPLYWSWAGGGALVIHSGAYVHTCAVFQMLVSHGAFTAHQSECFMQALHKFLKHEYRGFIVPPLPEKSLIQARMAHDDFIRLRRADLQVGSAVLHENLMPLMMGWSDDLSELVGVAMACFCNTVELQLLPAGFEERMIACRPSLRQ
jgi:hypothetical protein